MRNRLAAIALLSIALTAACSGGSDEASTPAAPATAPATAAAEATRDPVALAPIGPLPLGQTAETQALRVTIEGFRLDAEGLLRRPREGMVFLILTAHIANDGPKGFAISRSFQFSLADRDGVDYPPTVGAFERGSVNTGVPSGGELRGEVAFEVPIDSGPYELTFTQYFPTQTVTWTLPVEAAGTLAARPPIPQPRNLHESGEAARVGDVVVTVGGSRIAKPDAANPLPGRNFVAIELAVENRGEGVYRWTAGSQVYAQDAYGYTYLSTSVAYTDEGLSHAIAPGASSSGELAFDLPTDAAPYYLSFRAADSDEVAVWRVR